jgi:methyl-accepting chemotaxis protein
MLWMAGLSVLPLLVVGISTAALARREMGRQLEAALRARAQNFGGLVQSSVFEPLARDNVLRLWLRNPALRAKGCGDFLAAQVRRSRILLGAAILDRSGATLCASEPALAARSVPASSPWFATALEGILSSSGVSSSLRETMGLEVALAVTRADSAMAVLVASYRWDTLAQLIEEAAGQGRLTEDVGLQIVGPEGEILFDSAKTGARSTAALPSERNGVREAGGFVEAWSRNDLSPTDPGASLSYVARLPAAVAYAPANSLVRRLTLAIFGAAALAVIAAWFLSRRVVRPVTQLSMVVERIVREGDLTQKIEVRSTDEVGKLAAAFAEMVEKLRSIPRSLEKSVQLLADAMQRFIGSAEQQRESITRQAAALQQTTVTAQELRQTSAMAAEKARVILEAVSRADQVGESGEAAAAAGVKELAQIQQHVETISGKMAQLGESVQRIAGITGTVKDLADQSNMLALNAAIEAVRSGEAGRGFAVVAREIRSLADQSIQATSRVRENLDSIRHEVRQAVSVAEEGSRGVSAGINRVRGSGDSLRELSSIARESAAAVRQIAAAVSQQDAGIDQLFSTVRELSGRMSEIEKVLETSEESVSALNEVSQRIAGIVRGYRV